MHGVPNARAQVPMETFRRSKWNGGLGRTAQWPVNGSRRVPKRGTDRLGSVGGPFGDRGDRPRTGHDRSRGKPQDGDQRVAAPGARPWVSDGGQVGEQVRCFGFLGGTRHCANHTTVAAHHCRSREGRLD
jgi:hypothetical protein